MEQVASQLVRQITPSALAQKAVGPLAPFIAAYGEAPLLCVELSEDADADLEAGLVALRDTGEHMQNLGFHTVVGRSELLGAATAPRGLSAEALALRLHDHRHFIVPLVKRVRESMSMDRIAVGRARNKDVVLRHASVSKFHGWFEVAQDGAVRVADAGSTNGTAVHGKRLPPRELTAVAYGAPIAFGSVHVFVCDAMALWKALRR